jgi:hypothetical protein
MFGGGKAAYLYKLTSKTQNFKSINIGEKLDGSTPPSVFIGKFGYPKVFAGPMLSQQHGDTSVLDTPESWIPEGKFSNEIVNFRLQLVRGKSLVGIKDVNNKFVNQLQDIALAKTSAEAEAEFKHKPKGITFNEEHQPFGPSAQLKSFEIGNVKWEPQLEKVYHDTDLLSANAVVKLYNKDTLFSQIQKAFSVGTMGLEKNRKLVPTRWSITAVDDILGKNLLQEVKLNPLIENYQVHEFRALNNNFIILLLPTPWQYEWMEAFIHVMGNEEVIFSDWESNFGKKGYSSVGGCFYSVKMAACEHLTKIKKQGGVIVFREAYSGYVPLGVWLCREITREALKQTPKEFVDLNSALNYISTKLYLPMRKFEAAGTLLKTLKSQRTLLQFIA